VWRCSGLFYIGRGAGRRAALRRHYGTGECSSWPSNLQFPKELAPGECFFMVFKSLVARRVGVGRCLAYIWRRWSEASERGGEVGERQRRLLDSRKKNVSFGLGWAARL
jgi:hypothetical protein